MANIHLSALPDRVDEEHFELRLHASAITALQQRICELEAAVRELRTEAFDCSPAVKLSRHTAAPVRAVRSQRS